MSKHDTITDNLIALTRSRSFKNAVNGWSVKKLVALSKLQQQACELCGTRFRVGAVVEPPRSGVTIVVGGTCLKTLLARRFPNRFRFKQAKQFTFVALRNHYGPLVHPGNWLLWIRENAPARLAQGVADLYAFGAAADSEDLQQLIRFHDNKRLFPRRVLLTDPRALEHVLGIQIATYLTITQARKLVKKGQPLFSATKIGAAVAEYRKEYVLPLINGDPDLAPLWRHLGPLTKRAVTALAALDDRADSNDETPLAEAAAAGGPRPGEAPMFVWNPMIGLGFVGKDDVFEPPKAYVWLWRSGRYRKEIYSLDYWRGVIGWSLEAVEQLEELAFGVSSGVVDAGSAMLPKECPGL